MAYITKEELKVKREAIKKAFPRKEGWKFSITMQNHSSIHFRILEGPFNIPEKFTNGSNISSRVFEDRPKIKKAIEKMKNILNTVGKENFDNSDPMTDYFHVGFYVFMKIGSWDKKYIWNKQKI